MLRGQIRGLLQKIDMDSKMRKMAELQLSIVGDPKNRKAIENQVSNNLSEMGIILHEVLFCFSHTLFEFENLTEQSKIKTESLKDNEGASAHANI